MTLDQMAYHYYAMWSQDEDALDSPMTLEQLLLAVAGGDRRCFDPLYQRLAPSVLGLAYTVVRDHAQAEEVAQEVFLELWRTAPRYRPDHGTAVTWTLTLTHRRAVDRVRNAQCNARRDHLAAAKNHAIPFDQVAESAIGNIERQRVHERVQALSRCHREVLVLAYFDGLTFREVAHVLDVPLGTVKSRVHAALAQLRLPLR
jgi:RNA polymerase sigma-70 factor (ECF subfamily)